MDSLSLFSALQNVRLGMREVPPYMDDDLRVLIERARFDTPPRPSIRIDLAIGLADLLERIAARLRGEMGRFGVTHV